MEIAQSNRAMLRGALIPAVVVSLLATITSYILGGESGVAGSLLASFTVIIFFSISLLVGRLTRNADPITTMALAMFSYFTKLLIMAGFLLAVTRLTEPEMVDRRAFGISALGIALTWLAGEVRAFFRLRLQLPLPEKKEE